MPRPLGLVVLVLCLAAGGCGRSEVTPQETGKPIYDGIVRGLATAPTATPIPPTPKPKPKVKVAGVQIGPGDSVWYRLAQCESGGRWNIENPPYSGGLQFLPSTWRMAGGTRYAPRPSQATPAQQIQIAKEWLARTSWAQWPACSRKLGLR